jgi:hypothetical protein
MLTISRKTGNHGTEGSALGEKLEQSSGRVRVVGAAMGRGLRIQQVKLLAWLEAYSLAGSDGDLGSGPWITADPRLARAHIEDPKTTKLNPVAGRQGFLQTLEDRVNGGFRLVAR